MFGFLQEFFPQLLWFPLGTSVLLNILLFTLAEFPGIAITNKIIVCLFVFSLETSIYYPRAGAGISLSQFWWDPVHGWAQILSPLDCKMFSNYKM